MIADGRQEALPLPSGREEIRVRFAPNGEIHFAAFFTRTVLYSWLFARRYGGSFILRYDDTDRDRIQPGALDSYPDGLEWLGLDWDEGPRRGGRYGPYEQSQRRALYDDAIDTLIADGHAYYCYCSAERLAALASARRVGYDRHCRDLRRPPRKEAPPVVRFRVPDDIEVHAYDLLHGESVTPTDRVSDFIIRRSDGWPTYHLTVVVDDWHMRISHVLRGCEGLVNMAPQVLLHHALSIPAPFYLHFPLIQTPGFVIGDRLFPRGMGIYIDELAAEDFCQEAVINYYALLGYHHGSDREIWTCDELVANFDYRRISRRPFVTQSVEKLEALNREHLRRHVPNEDVAAACVHAIVDAGLAERDHATHVVGRSLPALRRRLVRPRDAATMLKFVFMTDSEAAADGGVGLDALAAVRRGVANGEPLREAVNAAAAEFGVPTREVAAATVAALGAASSPFGLDEIETVLTPAEMLRRLCALGTAANPVGS